jgi:membrane dipeptidase
MIQRFIERDGVIGAVMDAWMLQPSWVRGETTNENLTLAAVADQIDHVCQFAGNGRHAAVEISADGGYGIEQTRMIWTPLPMSRRSQIYSGSGGMEKRISRR